MQQHEKRGASNYLEALLFYDSHVAQKNAEKFVVNVKSNSLY